MKGVSVLALAAALVAPPSVFPSRTFAAPTAEELLDPSVQPALPVGKDVREIPYPEMHYARFAGRAFDPPLAWDDIIQVRLGSCFFLATLAAIVRTHPAFVAAAARRIKDGTYEVDLHRPDGSPATVALDDRLPALASGEMALSRGRDPADLRPALFEKAFAKLRGGYAKIDGGEPRDAFAALTGTIGTAHELEDLDEEEAWAFLRGLIKENRPATASTWDMATMKRLTGNDPDLDGMIEGHAYTLLDAVSRDGSRFVRLYTPLSRKDAGYAGDAPRVQDVPIAKFLRYFEDVTVGALAAE
ncbi:MAG: hypothetical protein HY078_01245 [Elusimicrobia bacterium]|nr:hypothetical protein [Elusimicrobiota bacterium]